MIETYNKKVNFVVLNCLGDIIKRYSLNTNYNLTSRSIIRFAFLMV